MKICLLSLFAFAGICWGGELPSQPDSGIVLQFDSMEAYPWDSPISYPEQIADSCPAPVYPTGAKQAKITGQVYLSVFINQNGSVLKWIIRWERPAGHGFADAVTAVLPNWRFKPAMEGGKPRGVWLPLRFNFPPKPKVETKAIQYKEMMPR